ncbi:hypothetical protein B0H14DRAFT_3725509 [Mycena olivaceomarginata]|nr:hypothetical protein B0H14DRAFT_3725509 [Mycena olivaceomarginata]
MLPTTTDPPKYTFAEIRAKAIKHLGSRPNLRASWLRRCRLLRFLLAGCFPLRSLARPALALAFLVYPAPVLYLHPASSLSLSSHHLVESAKRDQSTTTNGLISRASAFVPYDDHDPQLEHECRLDTAASGGSAGCSGAYDTHHPLSSPRRLEAGADSAVLS